MILTPQDGFIAATPQDAALAEAAGYSKCATSRMTVAKGAPYGRPCPFYLSPETQSALQDNGGYYTCPTCKQSSDFLHEMPWHGVPDDEMNREEFEAGGGTKIGLPMEVQAEIGENLVQNLGDIPGYGPITWWHEGGALSKSPLDGATQDWGVEVKTLGYDAMHHRFIPGRVKEKTDKNTQAAQMGKRGVLGILVLLDYRRSVADIYVREHPLDNGGVKSFRSAQGQHLVKEIPFKNPLMDPADPSPAVQKDEMPF